MNPSRPRRWVGFFLVLAALSVVAVVVPIVYNLSVQLRPEQLDDARRRWRERGPADYDLECLVKEESEGAGPAERTVLVWVRGGRVVLEAEDGELASVDPSLSAAAGPAALALAADAPAGHDVPALFDDMAAALRSDETAGRRNYAKADFDPRDGHPTHYIRRVRGRRDRVEWFVKLTPAGGGG